LSHVSLLHPPPADRSGAGPSLNPSLGKGAPLAVSDFRRRCLSEMLGTYLLVFFGAGSVVLVPLVPHLSSFEQLATVALVFGLTVGAMILLIGKHSGAHINPAITFASALSGKLKKELVFPYVFFQLLGALSAGLTLKAIFSGMASNASLGSTKLGFGISQAEGVSLEVAGTFVLAAAALTASHFLKRAAAQALLVGATLFVLILAIGPLTGASFNPARSLGPALSSGYLGNLLIYLIGPLVGAGLAGLLFGVWRRKHAKV
jgi:MIP family channel proteins